MPSGLSGDGGHCLTGLASALCLKLPPPAFRASVSAAEILYIVFGAILLLNTLQESGAIRGHSPEFVRDLPRSPHADDHHCLVVWQLY
jgi:hypothetical protein